MKKIIIIGIIIAIAIFFWSPWIGEDGGEKVIRFTQEMPQVQAEINILSSKYSCSTMIDDPNCCDGLSSSWAPFGRKVTYCKYGNWYMPFWGN